MKAFAFAPPFRLTVAAVLLSFSGAIQESDCAGGFLPDSYDQSHKPKRVLDLVRATTEVVYQLESSPDLAALGLLWVRLSSATGILLTSPSQLLDRATAFSG